MKRVHVMAAVLADKSGKVLIAQRPRDKHQGGLWEFPGGKLEVDEERWQGLRRELQEEIGIDIIRGQPLIVVQHDYNDKSVFLDVWLIDQWQGSARGVEGQEVRWVTLDELSQYEFPAANAPIIKALHLPDRYWITSEPQNIEEFLIQFRNTLTAHHVTLCQLRAKSLDRVTFQRVADEVLIIARDHGTKLLLNADVSVLKSIDGDGIHLTSERLMALTSRPISHNKVLGASVHSETQLRHACDIDVDFVVLGPVLPTKSHPEAPHLGWEEFQRLSRISSVPVFALGGMCLRDITRVRWVGGQGIAGISAFMENVDK
jgi:8-oxo-dGTP diphosphatase